MTISWLMSRAFFDHVDAGAGRNIAFCVLAARSDTRWPLAWIIPARDGRIIQSRFRFASDSTLSQAALSVINQCREAMLKDAY